MISIQNIEIAFNTPKGKFVAVKDINLEVAKGEIVSIIGHSGCGKSTILNAISGMVFPTKGKVLLNNKEVQGPGPDRGIVFQNYSLLPWLNVEENIYQAVDAALPAKSKLEKRALVEKYLQMVNLWEHREKYPKQISGGMKQRTAIARAFAIDPDVLLLDEPFGALDALTKGSLHIELLKMWNLTQRSKTIVMVTHDIEEAIFLSDRIIVMNNGPAATIREIEEVHLPRPRNKKEIVNQEEYKIIRERLLSLLMDKVEIDEEDFFKKQEAA
ncbi:ABC transporter ATP-binding protein [Ohtaekwangia koreensis]|uniref:Bicarbonate transport system ATP-binding protein n=1 Tax=Ohtaekwangia koreensis TaxID=688867 RepID=A0A1T5MHD0_9BACT|nr:ABC transporter ATP-binding protein [Ohtaekwangia koreensis]SKC87334.1 bicarbonate transport system ATP-binding protein [Ohtaekwangia koreensis]